MKENEDYQWTVFFLSLTPHNTKRMFSKPKLLAVEQSEAQLLSDIMCLLSCSLMGLIKISSNVNVHLQSFSFTA